jgi:transposase
MLLASHRSAIKSLSAECAAIEAELARRVAEDPQLASTFEILTSIPGIGERVATVLITELPEIGRIDRKAIASLAGLAPHISQPAMHRLARRSPAAGLVSVPHSTWPHWWQAGPIRK